MSLEAVIPPPAEVRARELIADYLRSIHQPNIEKNVEELMSFSGYDGRFEFFVPHIPESAKGRLLISGCAVGSEHMVARKFGFREVYGTEITSKYVEIARARLCDDPACFVDLYDGRRLPYSDGFFDAVYSGHVIEHTPDPLDYFREHMRVTRTGGFFFVEFPSRYHHTELHTGVRSFEWLPKALRAPLLRRLGGPRSKLDERSKLCYRDILDTLQPISLWQIRYYLLKLGMLSSRLVATQYPAPGFVRALIRK